LAGWLFADLLLGLAMLFFVFNTVGDAPTPEPTAIITLTLTATPSSTPSYLETPTRTPTVTGTPTSTPVATATLTRSPVPTPISGLKPQAELLIFKIDASGLLRGNLDQRRIVEDRIRQHFSVYKGAQRAGIVLTFGTSSNPQEGNDLAAKVNAIMREVLPEVFVPKGRPGETAFEDFHAISTVPSQRGEIEVRVYLLLNSSAVDR
jgi:hypothetical protein